PLDERRALLAALPLDPPLARVAALDDDKPWERACREGWEGVVAKRRGSVYEHRRSPHWLKMKCEASQELVVGGFTDPQGARVGLGALLVGYFEKHGRAEAGSDHGPAEAGHYGSQDRGDDFVESQDGGDDFVESQNDDDFVFAGKIGTGFDTNLLLDLRA